MTSGLNHVSRIIISTLANAVSVACRRPYRYADTTVGSVYNPSTTRCEATRKLMMPARANKERMSHSSPFTACSLRSRGAWFAIPAASLAVVHEERSDRAVGNIGQSSSQFGGQPHEFG